MKPGIKMVIVLTVIATLSGGVLSVWDGITSPRIEAHRLRELKAAITEVLPHYDSYEEITEGTVTLYVGRKKDRNTPVGVAFRVAGSGFQGKISIMVGVLPDFSEITGIKVLEQIETPGLGTKIVEDPSNKSDALWFPRQFKGVNIDPLISVVKNMKPSKPTEIQAITGATISSKAVVRILNLSIKKAKEVYRSKT